MSETCDSGDSFHLVTNVLVDTAGAADCDFFQTVIEVTKETVTGKIEIANVDGAYKCGHFVVAFGSTLLELPIL